MSSPPEDIWFTGLLVIAFLGFFGTAMWMAWSLHGVIGVAGFVLGMASVFVVPYVVGLLVHRIA